MFASGLFRVRRVLLFVRHPHPEAYTGEAADYEQNRAEEGDGRLLFEDNLPRPELQPPACRTHHRSPKGNEECEAGVVFQERHWLLVLLKEIPGANAKEQADEKRNDVEEEDESVEEHGHKSP